MEKHSPGVLLVKISSELIFLEVFFLGGGGLLYWSLEGKSKSKSVMVIQFSYVKKI